MYFWNRSRFARFRVTRTVRPKDSAPGQITLDRMSYPCLVRDMTPTSAIIEIDVKVPPDLPEYFFLRLDSERTHRRVRLGWQHRKQAGVDFFTKWSIKR